MQIKTTVRCHLTSFIVTIVNSSNSGDDVEILEPLHITEDGVKWCTHYEKYSAGFSKS